MARARIIQLSDLHLTAAEGDRARGALVWRSLQRVLGCLREAYGDADLLVATGDLASERRPETYARLRELLEPWRDRARLVPGNHDDRALVREAFGDTRSGAGEGFTFVARAGSFRVIGLDTLRRWRVHGRLGEAQLAWLKAELRERIPTLLFMHHPPIPVGTWWLDRDRLRDHRSLLALIRGSAVRGLFCGHVHQEATGQFGGVPVWTAPSTAYQFAPRAWLPRAKLDAPAFRLIELDGERVHTEVIRLRGGEA